MNFIEKRGFIDFESIEKRINIKLNNLSLIYASKKKINDELFFRYYKIVCMKYKDFDTFIALMKKNIVKLTLMLRFFKSGEVGKNIVFNINDKHISLLYNVFYYFEN